MTVWFSRLLGIGLSGAAFYVCAAIAFPWAPLLWFAPLPWFASLGRERGAAGVLTNAALMSAAFVFAVFPWFAFSVSRYTDLPITVSFFLLALAGPFLQPQFLAFALVRGSLLARGVAPGFVAVASAAVWTAADALLPRLFGDSLGHALYPFERIRQLADLTGVQGLTFLTVFVAQLIFHGLAAVPSRPELALRRLAVAAGAVGAVFVYGTLRLFTLGPGDGERDVINVAFVQAGDMDYQQLRARKGTYDAALTVLRAYEKLTVGAIKSWARGSGERPDLIVWPETVYPTTFASPKSPAGAELDARIQAFADSLDTPLLFGAYDAGEGIEYNAAFLLHPSRKPRELQRYRKRYLFPMTEALPGWLDHAWVRNALGWAGTWRPGNTPPRLELHIDRRDESVRILPLICLDAVVPGYALTALEGRPEAMVTISNDGWFAQSRGARLHLVVAAFRSIEARLPQLRVTNTGISTLIDTSGRFGTTLGLGKADAQIATVELADGRPGTLMSSWGDWFGPTCALVGLFLVAISGRYREDQ